MKSICRNLNNFWIFPVLFAVAASCLLLDINSFTGLFFIFSLIRLYRTGDHRLILFGSAFGVLLLVFSFLILLKEQREGKVSGQVAEVILSIDSDKIKVDGEYLQLEGLLSLSDGERQRIRASYYFVSEEEQKSWLSCDYALDMVVSGVLEQPAVRTNLNGFDYRSTLRNRQVHQVLTIEKIHHIKPQKVPWHDVMTHMKVWRRKLLLYCEKHFLPATAAYIQILLLGERSGDSELIDAFNQLGIVHLFSLSGMHVVFFFQFFRFGALKLGITIEHWFWLQLVISLLFGGLTGFSISVVRALLQTNISEGNRRFQFNLSPLDIWSFTLLFGIIFQPFILFSSAGQFSYFLSFSLLFIRSAIAKIEYRILQQFCFSALLSLFTLPLIAISSHEWQPIGIFLTFLLIPVFERVLLPVLTVVFVSSFFVRLSLLWEGLEAALNVLNKLFLYLSEWNHFTVGVGQIPVWLFLVELALLFLALLYIEKNWKYSAVYLSILLLLVNQKYMFQKGMVAYIDVGQGDSILIQAPFHGETLLIDTGGALAFSKEEWRMRKNKKSSAEYTVLPFLKSRGIWKLNKLFVTHADADHMGDILAISQRVSIEQVYFPEGADQDTHFLKILEQLTEGGTKCSPILSGAWIDSSFQLNILSPALPGQGSNEDSLVIHTNIAGRNFLFTGDLEEAGEAALIRKYPRLPIDVLKVAHHGSRTSTSKAFIEAFQPKQAVISSGRNNRYGHPHTETLSTLSDNNVEVFQTAKDGMIYYEWLPFTELSEVRTILVSD
ncbi:DNA internalization-related competence protein ComEC/Rec2 [Enterococcus sp. BWR-S5]|uniref:DNA internalization-related competence protein ComEC/Rec2 n=1 Tax=Enterococcus sp. BWR-S5 TaxID=2787714 RepID=UPI0019227747|nr:DNA internalization-related competence protein ComEC/Rec2 [Enterococcus sp. BWR-S5]MBL1225961.1 DNA internalization-related competence protein ComEC/Rec2 [Enterococcus sp. BWR-S5]